MNIFVLDKDIKLSVQYHCDKHVVKMILEAAQIASTVHWETGGEGPYKATHRNHPLVKWACSSLAAYKYVVRYGLALCREYTYRYGKIHKTQEKLLWLKENQPQVPAVGADFEIVVSEDCLIPGNAVESYRAYYLRHKSHLFQWTARPTPDWI